MMIFVSSLKGLAKVSFILFRFLRFVIAMMNAVAVKTTAVPAEPIAALTKFLLSCSCSTVRNARYLNIMVIHAAISAVLRIVSCTVSVFICVDGHCSWEFAFLISASIQPGSAAMQSLASWCTSVKNFFLSSGAWDAIAPMVSRFLARSSSI